jgi:hypothetical protein
VKHRFTLNQGLLTYEDSQIGHDLTQGCQMGGGLDPHDIDRHTRGDHRRALPWPVIPSKSSGRSPAEFDRDTCKWRHLIENFFRKLNEFRGIAMRCCKTGSRTSAFIASAATVIRLR